jgi:hypothetical protein
MGIDKDGNKRSMEVLEPPLRAVAGPQFSWRNYNCM